MPMRRTLGSGYMVLSGAAHTPAREDPLTPKQISRCRRPCDFLATSSVPPYGVSPGLASFSGDTPTQVGAKLRVPAAVGNRVIAAPVLGWQLSRGLIRPGPD